jgi:hypothetical protein
MARTQLVITQFSRAGSDIPAATPGDVTNGFQMTNDGRTGIIVTNTSTTDPHTVTFTIFTTVDGFPVNPRVETVPPLGSQGFGGFPTEDYSTVLLVDVDSAELTLSPVRI